MTSTTPLATAVAVLRDVPRSVDACRSASDASVMEWLRLAGEAKKIADVLVAVAAGEMHGGLTRHSAGRGSRDGKVLALRKSW